MISLSGIRKSLTVERVLSAFCFLAGFVFLVVALLGVWRHFFTMSLCVTVGVMISDVSGTPKKNRRHDRNDA